MKSGRNGEQEMKKMSCEGIGGIIYCAEIDYPEMGEKGGYNVPTSSETLKSLKGEEYRFFWHVNLAGVRTGSVFMEKVDNETIMASFVHMSEKPIVFLERNDGDNVCWINDSRVYSSKKEAQLELFKRKMTANFPTCGNMDTILEWMEKDADFIRRYFRVKRGKKELRRNEFSQGDTIMEIGMKEPKILSGLELVFADQNGILCIFPYRDAERTKITLKTKSAYVVAFGVPGISSEDLRYSLEKVSDIIETNALGKRCSISFS